MFRSTLIFLMVCIVLTACTTTKANTEQVNLYLVGDSTMSTYPAEVRPRTGWGEKLSDYFGSELTIHNHAMSGRSTKSFRDEGRWEQVLALLEPGDYVFIQFGHNDEKDYDPTRFTNPYSTYRYNLRRYVEETRKKQATPVLLSSIVRRSFNDTGSLLNSHGPYPEVMRQLALELDVAFIDMNTLSEQLVFSRGVEGSKELFLHLKPGAHPNYPNGVEDDTHFNQAGAEAMAELASKEICRQKLQLSRYLRDCK